MRENRIAVDWDSTLCTEVWPGMGEWLPGAVQALRTLALIYDEVVIFTLRVSPVEPDEYTKREPWDQILAINMMLEKADIPKNVYVWTRTYKPPCEILIDDRALRFEGDWDQTLAQVGLLRATNRKETVMVENDCGCEECVCESPGEKAVREYKFEHDSPHPGLEKLFSAPPVFSLDLSGATLASYDANLEEGFNAMREFETGATRNVDQDQLDYEGFLSPLALWAYAAYMHKNRVQADGSLRDSDNWQKGIPLDSYRKSLIRHVMDVWLNERGFTHLAREDTVTALCAIIFNAQGLLHETLRDDL